MRFFTSENELVRDFSSYCCVFDLGGKVYFFCLDALLRRLIVCE